MAERKSKDNWVFTQVYLQEMKQLANGATRKRGDDVRTAPMGGSAIAVYINLRGRCYASKRGIQKFYCWCSQEGIAQDLNWDLKNGPKNRVSDAIRALQDAGFIRVWTKEDRSAEALELRKKLKCGRSTSLYEMTLFKSIVGSGLNMTSVMSEPEQGHVQTGGHSGLNMSKEEEPNNKKEEDYSIINNEERLENAFRDFMGEDYNSGGTTPSEIYNRNTDRYVSVKKLEERILSDWDWKPLFDDYDVEDIWMVVSGMNQRLKIVQEIKSAVNRIKVGLELK